MKRPNARFMIEVNKKKGIVKRHLQNQTRIHLHNQRGYEENDDKNVEEINNKK